MHTPLGQCQLAPRGGMTSGASSYGQSPPVMSNHRASFPTRQVRLRPFTERPHSLPSALARSSSVACRGQRNTQLAPETGSQRSHKPTSRRFRRSGTTQRTRRIAPSGSLRMCSTPEMSWRFRFRMRLHHRRASRRRPILGPILTSNRRRDSAVQARGGLAPGADVTVILPPNMTSSSDGSCCTITGVGGYRAPAVEFSWAADRWEMRHRLLTAMVASRSWSRPGRARSSWSGHHPPCRWILRTPTACDTSWTFPANGREACTNAWAISASGAATWRTACAVSNASTRSRCQGCLLQLRSACTSTTMRWR